MIQKKLFVNQILNTHRCIVFGCTNEKHQGSFVGDICSPCYKIITEGDTEQPSTNFIHALGLQNKRLKAKLETLAQRSGV
jgi:hypothetical protein